MCNHYFFEGENLQYRDFLKKSNNLAIVTDPPFGVKVELIWNGCMVGVLEDLKQGKITEGGSPSSKCLTFELFEVDFVI